MGRKNRKKKENLAYIPDIEPDPGMTKSYTIWRKGNFNHDSELKEHISHNLFDDDRYFTDDEKQEVENFIYYFFEIIFERMDNGYDLISTETCLEVMNTPKGKEGHLICDILGYESIPIHGEIDIIVTLLTTEALRKGFVNVLVYTRFLQRCLIRDDKDDPTHEMLCPCEQDEVKRQFHMEWNFSRNFKCRGVYVDLAPLKSKHVWDVPVQCNCG